MKLGVLTGLAREVNCLPRHDVNLEIRCSGANSDRAETLSNELVECGCGALLSFGVAGALSPDLEVGDVVVASGVIDAKNGTLDVAENWKNRVLDGLPKARGTVKEGWIYGSDTEIASPHMKEALFKQTGALCVDMESHRMARVASRQATPYLSIRVISDDAHSALPSAALGVIGENGKPIINRVIKGLLKNPQQILQLIALSKNMDTAICELRSVSRLIGPLFRFA